MHIAPEKLPYAMGRFEVEALRLIEVIDRPYWSLSTSLGWAIRLQTLPAGAGGTATSMQVLH
jgi:hypothetical protein